LGSRGPRPSSVSSIRSSRWPTSPARRSESASAPACSSRRTTHRSSSPSSSPRWTWCQRGRRADEFLRCLKAIWMDDVVESAGDFYQVPRSKIEPKPVQKPHPPITIGGYSPVVITRAVTLGDGFNGGNVPLDRVTPMVAELRKAAVAAKRDPATLHIVSRGAFHVHDTAQGPARRPLWG